MDYRNVHFFYNDVEVFFFFSSKNYQDIGRWLPLVLIYSMVATSGVFAWDETFKRPCCLATWESQFSCNHHVTSHSIPFVAVKGGGWKKIEYWSMNIRKYCNLESHAIFTFTFLHTYFIIITNYSLVICWKNNKILQTSNKILH